jgi:hypothetical protein
MNAGMMGRMNKCRWLTDRWMRENSQFLTKIKGLLDLPGEVSSEWREPAGEAPAFCSASECTD